MDDEASQVQEKMYDSFGQMLCATFSKTFVYPKGK